MFREDSVVRARTDNMSVDLDAETVILDTASGTYFGLNEVGKAIWELIAEPRSVSGLCDTIATRFHIDADACMSDVIAFLTDLESEGLVERHGAPSS